MSQARESVIYYTPFCCNLQVFLGVCYSYCMSVKKCYLIGGAPLSGKTTLAALKAAQHQATQISTDNIRDWMKRVALPEQYPDLFAGSELNAEAFYREYNTPEKVLKQQVDEGFDVAKGIKALLECYLPWERLIIEGIAITPTSAKQLIADFPSIEFEVTFLYDNNTKRIQQRIKERGLWSKANTYPEHIQEKELPWVILYNEFYQHEARLLGFELLQIDQLT